MHDRTAPHRSPAGPTIRPPRTLALALVGLLACSAGLSGSVAAQAGPLDRIAYQDSGDIWVVDEDGNNAVNLTAHPAQDLEPGFSPDGTRIAFASDRAGTFDVFDIFVMNDDGTGVVNLTPGTPGSSDRSPAFSSDGESIVFESDRDGDFDIWMVPTSGGPAVQITGIGGADGRSDHQPEFSPTDDRIAYLGSGDPAFGNAIFVLDLGTMTETVITSGALQANGFPTFSPDGQLVALQGFTGPQSDIWLVRADGSGDGSGGIGTNLTNRPGSEQGTPSFDRDENRIAYSGNQDGGFDIYLIDTAGNDLGRVTGPPGKPDPMSPSFGPPADPTGKADCRGGGWRAFGFRNQGQCIRFVTTGQDSR